MISGIYVKYILENELRIYLDDYGYSDVSIEDDEAHSWVLYRDGNLVGRASYDLNNILVEIKS
jgi:hypothetical protein